MGSSSRKGTRGEHELLGKFEEEGFYGIRAPASGTGDRELPDLFVGNGESFIALEVKRVAPPRKYINGHEVNDLQKFAEAFTARHLIAIRFDYGDWWFLCPKDLHETDGGQYRVDEEDVDERGVSFPKLLEQTRKRP